MKSPAQALYDAGETYAAALIDGGNVDLAWAIRGFVDALTDRVASGEPTPCPVAYQAGIDAFRSLEEATS